MTSVALKLHHHHRHHLNSYYALLLLLLLLSPSLLHSIFIVLLKCIQLFGYPATSV